MRKEYQLSVQPLLMLKNPVFKIERPRPFYSPPEKCFSIQSRYHFNVEVENVTKTVALFVDAEAKLLVRDKDTAVEKTGVTKRTNMLKYEDGARLDFMFIYDTNELVYNALREDSQRLLPTIKVTLYYKNTSGGCFKTSSVYKIALDEENEPLVKEWHTYLESAGARFKEIIDQMKRSGDYSGKAFKSIKERMNDDLGEVRDICIECFEEPEQFLYSSVSHEEYENGIENIRYPIRLIKQHYCCNNKVE